MTAARSVGGPAYTQMIEEMDKDLAKVIEDFDRAMNFEALRLANETSKLPILRLSAVDLRGLVQSRRKSEQSKCSGEQSKHSSKQSKHEKSKCEKSKREKSKSICSDGSSLSRPTINATSAVWTVPANLSSIKSWIGQPIDRGGRMFS